MDYDDSTSESSDSNEEEPDSASESSEQSDSASEIEQESETVLVGGVHVPSSVCEPLFEGAELIIFDSHVILLH